MQIAIFYDRWDKSRAIKLAGNPSVKDLLEKMKLNPVTVIISRNNTIITEEEKLKDRDKIRLISVVSGG
ncbi:MoaD/ThiS family protein [Candidatus Woesearchaeota archaeon]|nr:MoaD/ThiS family protein [Candidatus Woesearchaeota archaeon]